MSYVLQFKEKFRGGNPGPRASAKARWGEKTLLGIFYKLGGSGARGRVSELIARNSSLPVKMAVQVFTLDPRMPDDETLYVIQNSLKPLAGGA